MNRSKKFSKTAVSVAAVLAFGTIISACGKSDPKPDASSSPSASPGGTSASQAPGKPKIKIVWAIPQLNTTASLPPADQDFVKKAIDEKFNVDFTFMPLSGTDFENLINVKLASGEQLDLFQYPGVSSNKLIKDGAVKDLSNLLTPQKVPNYFKWVTEKELKGYQVQNVFKRAPFPFPQDVNGSYYIRKDWLDKLNLKMPTNYDEMLEAMKAFTTKDPDGNGKNDTYGFTTAGNGGQISYEFPTFLKNGIQSTFWIENDVLRIAKYDANLGKLVDELLSFIDTKVVDPDWFLNKSSQIIEKAAQGKVGVIQAWGNDIAYDNNPNGLQRKTRETTGVKTADWEPFNPFPDKDFGVGNNPGNYNPFLINGKSSDDAAARSMDILNWLTSEEGFLLTHYGKEGVHYKKNGKRIELNPEAFNIDIVKKGNFLSLYSQFTPSEPNVLGLELFDPNETDRDRAILKQLRSYKKSPSIGTSLSVGEGMDLPSLSKKGTEYINKMLFEDKSGANWPKYRQDLIDKFGMLTIFNSYADQVTTAQGRKITFK